MTPTPTPTDLLLLDLDERPWAAYAACRDSDPDLFFPAEAADATSALKICQGCPVQPECLDWALEMRITYGVWGGATERDRRRILRKKSA